MYNTYSMKTLHERQQQADALLASCAVPTEGTLGREFPEEADDTRFSFQRDRDRIVHTQSFRRLKGKTQVFVTGQGDHYRTRLTHTMEVAVISRDIARTLSLNEDLAECIALAHDLGHPPFGHAGEETLNEWMKTFGSSFEHNHQSYRIVTILEQRTHAYTGLNLNREVLDALLKHQTPHDHPKDADVREPSLEAQLVNIADEIAYTGHDCDDGLKVSLFSSEEIGTIPLVKSAYKLCAEKGTALRGALIHLLVHNLYTTSEERLRKIHSLEEVYTAKSPCITFSERMKQDLHTLREFLWDHMYLHPQVLEKSTQGKEVVHALCTHLYKHPTPKVLALQKLSAGALQEAVKDYVCGMTDGYAVEQMQELQHA